MENNKLTIVHLGKIPKTIQKFISSQGERTKQLNNLQKLNQYLLLNSTDICILSEKNINKSDQKKIVDFNSNTSFIILCKNKTKISKNRVYYVNVHLIDNKKLLYIFLNNLFTVIINFRKRDDFTAMLLHDVRSPVNSIIGYLELVDNEVFGKLNDGQKKIIENTIVLGDMLIDFVEDFNFIREYENRDLQLNLVSLNINDILKNVLLSIWVQADQKNIKIHKNIESDIPNILGDSFKIQRVLMNLLQNAIKFSPERGELKVSVKQKTQTCIQVSVSDTGPGIEEKYKKQIFNKYFHVGQNKQKENNFGLGLYIAKSIVETHGGKIWVKNNPETGATFYFTLKINRDDNIY